MKINESGEIKTATGHVVTCPVCAGEGAYDVGYLSGSSIIRCLEHLTWQQAEKLSYELSRIREIGKTKTDDPVI